MLRLAEPGASALEVARGKADSLASDGSNSVVVYSAAPWNLLAGAAEWLGTQPGQREIVLLSDFQTGTVHRAALQPVPRAVGVRLIRSDILDGSSATQLRTQFPGGVTITSAARDNFGTSAEWSYLAMVGDPRLGAVEVLSATGESAYAEAASEAALHLGIPTSLPTDSGRAVVVVFPEYERGARLSSEMRPLDQHWMGDVLLALHRNSLLSAASDAVSGLPRAGVTTIDGAERMTLISGAPAGSLASAALLSATARALHPSPAPAELNPDQLSLDSLNLLQREAGERTVMDDGAQAGGGSPDARWFWLLALALLAVEWRVRRAIDGYRAGSAGSPA
jgi:hypothetical protein